MRLSIFQKVLWALAATAALGLAGYFCLKEREAGRIPDTQGPAFHAAFELTDHKGIVRTEEDFAGRWMLVFFGFTNCPDICPTTLAEISAVMEGLKDEAAKIQPIFITVDPERDTPTALAEYVSLFDAGIIGLTGTPEQIAQTSEAFPIFYQRIEEAAAPGGYSMTHTSHLFLFDPEAGFADSWSYGTPAEEILTDLRGRI